MTMENYLDALTTPAVLAVREEKGSAGTYRPAPPPAALEPAEVEYITERDSFYIATVGESGWPYVQHRGGEAGFVRVLGPTTIGWVERSGNRQYLGTGNITADDRVSMILVDYPNRTRLKLRGHATYHPNPAPGLVTALGGEGVRVDGAITVEVVATDWNCPKYITPRYTAEQVAVVTDELHARIADLERQLRDRDRVSSI
jgi:predicted pyridoxine 5'-phosphate oxidase superfamily flavin-nucleotide-binding protein